MAALGQHRQVFANLEAGRLRGNWLELAANLFRGVGLHVKAVLLSQSAREKNIDHCAGLGGLLRRWGRHRAQRLDVVHAQAEQPNGARLQGRAARAGRVLKGWRGMLHD